MAIVEPWHQANEVEGRTMSDFLDNTLEKMGVTQ